MHTSGYKGLSSRLTEWMVWPIRVVNIISKKRRRKDDGINLIRSRSGGERCLYFDITSGTECKRSTIIEQILYVKVVSLIGLDIVFPNKNFSRYIITAGKEQTSVILIQLDLQSHQLFIIDRNVYAFIWKSFNVK